MFGEVPPAELYNVDIASFYPTERDIQKLVLGIDPMQDLHGYDNPWPAGGGVNLLAPAQIADTTVRGVRFYADGDGTMQLRGTSEDGYSANFIYTIDEITLPSSDIYVHLLNPVANAQVSLFFYYNGSNVAGITLGAVNRIYKLTNLSGATINQINLVVASGQTVDITLTPMLCLDNVAKAFSPYSNICPISGWTGTNIYVSPTLDVQDATVYPISWHNEAGTVYGGTLDVLTGVLTVTWKSADMGDFPWVLRNNNQHRQAWKTDVSDMKFVPNDYPNPPPLLCEILKTIVPNTSWRSYEITYYDGQLNAMVATNEYADAEAFTTAMSGVQLVYEIATPLTYQLTPQQIATLHPGINNVWCDTGPVIELIS